MAWNFTVGTATRIRYRRVRRSFGFVGLIAWAIIEYGLSGTPAEKWGELLFSLLTLL